MPAPYPVPLQRYKAFLLFCGIKDPHLLSAFLQLWKNILMKASFTRHQISFNSVSETILARKRPVYPFLHFYLHFVCPTILDFVDFLGEIMLWSFGYESGEGVVVGESSQKTMWDLF